MRRIKPVGWVAAMLLLCGSLWAADVLPPAPASYVEDKAGVLSPGTVAALNTKLEENEKQTSNQIVVAIYPDLPADAALEDFTNRTFHAWGVGQKGKDNGAVLFIFPNARKMRIEVGYGLEGAIPDATAKQILDSVLRPAFRQGDFNGGVTLAVDAILAASRGEYQGTGRTVAQSGDEPADDYIPLVLVGFFVLIALVQLAKVFRSQRGNYYGPQGRRGVWVPPIIEWGSNAGSSSSWSGGDSGGSSGGFSGGGGDSGGGGASGGW